MRRRWRTGLGYVARGGGVVVVLALMLLFNLALDHLILHYTWAQVGAAALGLPVVAVAVVVTYRRSPRRFAAVIGIGFGLGAVLVGCLVVVLKLTGQ